MKTERYNYDSNDRIVSDYTYTPKHTKFFDLNPFTITEIQYIRGLIYSDQLENNYKEIGMKARIDNRMSMWEFTEQLMKKLDEMEVSKL